MGRPLKEVDERQVFELASMMCSLKEIAVVCGVSHDTIERRFASVIKDGHENAKQSIRKAQYKVGVEDLNCTMLIWLGKNYLDQSDNKEVDLAKIPDDIFIAEARRRAAAARLIESATAA